jgi:hypothetical protein
MIRSDSKSDEAIDTMLAWVDKLRELIPSLKTETESEVLERLIQSLWSWKNKYYKLKYKKKR